MPWQLTDAESRITTSPTVWPGGRRRSPPCSTIPRQRSVPTASSPSPAGKSSSSAPMCCFQTISTLTGTRYASLRSMAGPTASPRSIRREIFITRRLADISARPRSPIPSPTGATALPMRVWMCACARSRPLSTIPVSPLPRTITSSSGWSACCRTIWMATAWSWARLRTPSMDRLLCRATAISVSLPRPISTGRRALLTWRIRPRVAGPRPRYSSMSLR